MAKLLRNARQSWKTLFFHFSFAHFVDIIRLNVQIVTGQSMKGTIPLSRRNIRPDISLGYFVEACV